MKTLRSGPEYSSVIERAHEVVQLVSSAFVPNVAWLDEHEMRAIVVAQGLPFATRQTSEQLRIALSDLGLSSEYALVFDRPDGSMPGMTGATVLKLSIEVDDFESFSIQYPLPCLILGSGQIDHFILSDPFGDWSVYAGPASFLNTAMNNDIWGMVAEFAQHRRDLMMSAGRTPDTFTLGFERLNDWVDEPLSKG